LSARLTEAGANVEVMRHASIFWIRRRTDSPVRRPDRIPTEHAGWYARLFHAALSRGVYLPPSPYEVCFLSLAHDEAVLAQTIDVLVEAAREAEHP
jgi:glutamate-1-semialdehyde 2,1-aminomutase